MTRSVLIVVAVLGVNAGAAAPVKSVWDGVYTKAQAVRGKALYNTTCARCHGETLLGGDDARALAGEAFLKRWEGKDVFLLFDISRRKMPDDGPNVLSRAETADVVAYLLSSNGFPAGAADLPREDDPLKEVLITAKK